MIGNYKRGPGNYKSSYLTTIIKKTDEIVNNSTTFQYDEYLQFKTRLNTTYNVTLKFIFQSSTTADLKYRLEIPFGGVADRIQGEWQHGPQNTSAWTTSQFIPGQGDKRIISVHGIITTASTEGSIKMEWAQNTLHASDTTIYAGSLMTVVEA